MNTFRVFETKRTRVLFSSMKNMDALQEDGE